MASPPPPQAAAHSPSGDLHTQSLSFSLDALDALSSAQLALVQFHPRADDAQTARARALFVRRRMAWLEQEMDRATAREQAAVTAAAERELDRSRSPFARVKEEQDESLVELQPEAGRSTSVSTSSPAAQDESSVGAAKREGGQKEREVQHRQLDAPRPPPRVLSPSATPTPTGATASTSARAIGRVPRAAATTTSTTVDPRRRPRPPAPAPAPVPATAVVVKREVEEISLLDDDDDEREGRPSAPPRAQGLSPPTKRSGDVAAAAGARPSKAPRRALSAASPPLPPTAERLKAMPSFRRKGQMSPPLVELSTRGGLVPTPTPTPTPPPAPTFLPHSLNSTSLARPVASTDHSSFAPPPPSSSRIPIPRGIQAALRAGRAPLQSDWEFEHWLHPPSPFPTLRMYTVRVHGLSDYCTAALVYYFLMRNQGRLRPRPLAIRAEDGPRCLEGACQARHPVFFFAFGSLEAAELIVTDNDRRLLPNMDQYEPRQISIELVRDDVSADATWEARRASEAKELEVGWRWGELSDEARWYWARRADLPPSPVCPRFEDVEIKGRPVSDEYSDEADRIDAEATGKSTVRAQAHLLSLKKDLYNSCRQLWRAWLALGPTEQAAAEQQAGREAPVDLAKVAVDGARL
ncbi:uncharacterized protein RHOBADRAFT_51384 [Rhodotorula graminis WP1]|uniref:Uncharacterized protein n=1 Tax=Rhodotorula graminis (strain WP1) TaxID=578459 RepID=A0A194SAA7_RHOGW|nr:uncharacterized protein RHOBADRAFT_51384 [Rhodotorula graminis WP1]KPV77542.1 hypothetical protein RHOBADRAFT_51384 [Rhodotorula graminis WP1]